MAFSRKTLRANTAALIKTAVLPGTTTLAFTSVFEGAPDQVLDEDMPTCIVRAGPTRERRLAGPAGYGIKQISCPVTIDIFFWADSNDDILGERYLDDVLDGIDVALRSSPGTLTGAVAIAYEEVDTEIAEPINSLQDGDPAGKLLLHATRTFSASAFDGG